MALTTKKSVNNYERSLRMSSNSSQKQSGGISFAGALGLLFIGLKLGHVITWPWIWVLAPFWAGVALIVLVVAVLIVLAALVETGKKARR